MAADEHTEDVVPVLIPVEKPLSPIPVGLKEAALDSPTFRATAVHFTDQVEAVERWLDGLVKTASRFTQELLVFEASLHSFLASVATPNHLSEAVLDHDYTVLAMQRYHESVRDFWTTTFAGQKKVNNTLVEPIKAFMSSELKPFKDARRQLDQTQKYYDGILSRFSAQAKSKEASSLREDAFQLHEARKAYLKASMDFCVLAPQLRLSLDSLLISVISDQWTEMKKLKDSSFNIFGKHGLEMERIQCWSQEMKQGEKALKRELHMARRKVEESTESAARPSRELDDYATSTVPYLGTGPSAAAMGSSSENVNSSKQGWLFLKTMAGKPARATWIRRWFFVKNGIFGWLVPSMRSGGVEESEKIGVLLCNIRPAFQEERRFCFEVKTKDTTLLLQTESQSGLTDWLAVFEKAKRQALEEPTTTDLLASSGNPSSDAAFAVNPPVAPEFAARRADGQITNIAEEISGSHLGVEDVAQLVTRGSFDVTGQGRTIDKDGDRNRDHATRIIQKLDLHRKTTAGAQITPGTGPSTPTGGGIASLISASSSALPLARTPTLPPADLKRNPMAAVGSTSLAPSTLVNPPAPTSLSKTAIVLALDKGLDLGIVDGTGGMPSSLMANQWGSLNYGHLSRIDRGEIKRSRGTSLMQQLNNTSERRSSDPPPPTPDPSSTADPLEKPLQRSTSISIGPSPAPSPPHRKPLSVLNETSPAQKRDSDLSADLSTFYPLTLRAHDAQFRMLFPNMSSKDRIVLVFRGSWNPDENQDLPGRIYVTVSGNMYFYSHHFGLVTVSSVDLSRVSGITASTGPSHDLLQFHLKPAEGRGEPSVLTIKTFLEPLRLLRRRLEYLVANASTEDSDDLDDVIRTLSKMPAGDMRHRSSVDSLEDLALSPTEETHRSQERGSNLNIDRKFYGGDSAAFYEPDDVLRFKLPSQPVQYTPHNVPNLAIERIFDVSAKALYHIIFGDKSAVCQILYRQRRAEAVKQYPWTKVGQGHFRRQFEYEIQAPNSLGFTRPVTIVDLQVIDVASDHLCYVVTDTKTPWHLPYPEGFSLVSKIVITHYAKSKCKLAIFTRTAWKSKSGFSSGLIERRALDDLYLDALDMVDLVTDQVQRLGPNFYTKRAIQIFGHIGHQKEAAQITSADISILERPLPVMVKRTSLVHLIYEHTRSTATSFISTVLMSIIGLGKALLKALSFQKILTVLLLASIGTQLLAGSEVARNWQRDMRASTFMSRVGVGPNPFMSRAVYIKDIHELAFDVQVEEGFSDNKCSNAFTNMLTRSDIDLPADFPKSFEASTALTSHRLHRTRQRMGMYRHDLLVALRLVNNIERDTVRAEYENWLISENVRCRQVEKLLRRNDTQGAEFAEKLSQVEGDGGNGWWKAYCESCATEQETVLASV